MQHRTLLRIRRVGRRRCSRGGGSLGVRRRREAEIALESLDVGLGSHAGVHDRCGATARRRTSLGSDAPSSLLLKGSGQVATCTTPQEMCGTGADSRAACNMLRHVRHPQRKAAGVVPVDPAKGGQLDVVNGAPRPLLGASDELGLVVAVDGLSERVDGTPRSYLPTDGRIWRVRQNSR